jgi:menaquinone-dependent protoporphyrinogen oxidase
VTGQARNRILVAYASWAGSAREVAETVGRVLRESGADVDVLSAADVRDLEPYRAVVVGSAVRAGRVKREALRFARANAAGLRTRPVAFFIVCLTMMEDNLKNRTTADPYLDPLREIVPPIDVGLFGGVFMPQKLKGAVRLLVSASRLPRGDFTDLAAVEDWARQLLPKLAPRA